ncbi:MAG TPA: response regulator transcription factor [Acidimicrobiales bacterium]|nr:response regulator transcription factor [Acidimicrobiales bacterium]
MIRVLLVDDQQLIRTGLQRILAPRAGFEIVGECSDGSEVEDAVMTHRPDLVIMDARMKDVGGAEATRRLRLRPDSPPVLILTTFDDDEVLSASLRAGASGFQLKDAPGEDLIRAAKVVAAGGAWLDPTVTARVLAAYRTMASPKASGPRAETLSQREREVLALIGRGLSNTEVAAELHISEVTVKSHVGHIFTKLNLRDRAAAIVFAFDNGIVEPQA